MATIISFPQRPDSSAAANDSEKSQPSGETELSLLWSTLETDLVLLRAGLVELNRRMNVPCVPRAE